jgi:sugar lactone lactonase YvrE
LVFLFLLEHSSHIHPNSTWKQNGITIAGGNGQGNQLNQLSSPYGIDVDDDNQCIYIADWENHRIVEWKYGATKGQVVAGGNGEGNRMDQLNRPGNVIVDKKTNSLIIADQGNNRVVRWSRENDPNPQIIISNIACRGLTMNNNGDLYVSDREKNEVRRWKIGETNGTLVAGENGQGDHLNQFNAPTYIFVDQDDSVYVSDYFNDRVMKWLKGAKEGIVVAGGQGRGNSLTQLSHPQGVIVDHLGHVYMADWGNDRIMRWCLGSKEGSIVVEVNGRGQQTNHFYGPTGLSFDRQGNMYVVDCRNQRVQKFNINLK